MILKYEGNQIINSCAGDGFNEFQQQFSDDERAFAYLRINVRRADERPTAFDVAMRQRLAVGVCKVLVKAVMFVNVSLRNVF